jgi:hypothetical protein
MSVLIRGPWSHAEIETYLTRADFPLRLASAGSDGFPRLVSLWYRYQAGDLYCVTHRDSMIASLIGADERVGFEVSPNEPPYSGVRGQARARLTPLGDSPMLVDLLQHYLGDTQSDLATWLLGRSDEELLIRITPEKLFCWDYRQRMDGAA